VPIKIESQLAAEAIDESLEVLQALRHKSFWIDRTAEVLVDALKNGNKILTCGNGGSAADALHMAEELVGRYKLNRRPLPAISLAADPTLLTCIGNDFGFQEIFSRQIQALAKEGDVVVTFSSSGDSPNLVRALESARRNRATSIAVLGKFGGAMAGKANYELIVPSMVTARIQEVHTLVLHSWLERIDAEFVI
jgi:D-sedoheptulose 7-phosphate isomerase